ncbi:probable protein phosphatase 2C 80 [Vicia villosa]|uniref:probable protein phosphatase 2C 80 n=1 Tax=Vicia villosa TaxID=3911 RepID=UPI00273B0A40|nr:probable protein phosphatase 2C 80 [Vicia villosa]
MLCGNISKLKATIYCGIHETITRKQRVPIGRFNNPVLPLSSLCATSFLSNSTSCLNSKKVGRKLMASSSNAMLGDVYVDDLISSYGGVQDLTTKHAGVSFKERPRKGFVRASVSLRRTQQLLYGPLNFGRSGFDSSGRIQNSGLLHGPWLKNLSSSSSACCLAGAAHDLSFDNSHPDEQLENSSTLSSLTTLDRKPLKMLSGSCYLPHPAKAATGGEDAHFICSDEQAIGVADGVGGWADVGVNAGLFAQELLSNSVRAVQEEPKGSFNPVRVLEKAHSNTKSMGSSTACIIALTDEALNAINLGDSGFIVIRGGSVIFKSPAQQHDFNFPYQLDRGNTSDLPSSGEVFTIPVASGDIIVAGTDGLFDNLYNNDIVGVVVSSTRAGLEPQATAQKIAALAQERALDKKRHSPFSTAALEAGHRYYGGKLDDITVVVSYISSSASE